MVLCQGCFKAFSSFGYTSHLAQTKKPLCVAQRHAKTRLDSTSEADSSHDDDDQHNDMDALEDLPPCQFQGDHFGMDYSLADFAWPEDDLDDAMDVDPAHLHPRPLSSPPENELGDKLEDEDETRAGGILDEALRPHWEPAPNPAGIPARTESVSGPTPNETSTHHVSENTGNPASLLSPPAGAHTSLHAFNSEQRVRAEAALHQKIHTVCFPSDSAGKPMASAESEMSATAARAGYAAYEADIKRATAALQRRRSEHVQSNNQDLLNIYAPFPSWLDWKLARWSKLRGPTSTAVTELLDIDGVRPIMHLGTQTCC